MRFVGFVVSMFAVATGGCAAHPAPPVNAPPMPGSQTAGQAASRTAPGSQISGVWDALSRTTIGQGIGAGDMRIEKQEWHLSQAGSAISGYYITALTFVSGDGRPYVCNRLPQFSATQRFNVAGEVRGGHIEIEEKEQRATEKGNRCDPGQKRLARYSGRLEGDVMTLMSGAQRQTLYRIHHPEEAGENSAEQTTEAEPLVADASEPGDSRRSVSPAPVSEDPRFPDHPATALALTSLPPADVSGMWIWEHSGVVPGGDQKQEREEWHVTQDGSKLTGYYDRVVHQVSSDGQAYRCSMALDFQIVTRYQFRGEVQGSKIMIYESSFEVLNPNACDNGKRRLDAYEGQAAADELRLVWGVGGQVLRRPRPDVPTQRF
jgi:hypothetical protein